MLLTLILLTTNLALLCLVLSQRKRKADEPPLIKHNIPFIGGALTFGKEHLGYLQSIQRKFGDIFTLTIAGWKMHFFMNPLDIRYLDRCREAKQTPVLTDFVTRMVGPNHGIVEKDSKESSSIHNIQKNLRSPEQRASLLQVCANRTEDSISQVLRHKACENSRDDEVDYQVVSFVQTNLLEFCEEIIFDTSFAMFYGQGCQESYEETLYFYKLFSAYNKDSAYLVDRIPIYFLPETKEARAKMLEELSKIDFNERKNVSQLVRGIVDISRREGQSENISPEVMVILWASLANTVPALFWTLYHLLTNPYAFHDVLEEIKSVEEDLLNVKPHHEFPVERLSDLVVLESCIYESLRLCGSAMSIRKVTKPTLVRTHDKSLSYRLREGDYTAVYAPTSNMNPEIYHNPEEYDHLRYIDEYDSPCKNKTQRDCNKNLSRIHKLSVGRRLQNKRKVVNYKQKNLARQYTHLTFGYGSNRCPGRHVAIGEIKLIVFNILKKYKLQLLDKTKTLKFNLKHLGFGLMPPVEDVAVKFSLFQ